MVPNSKIPLQIVCWNPSPNIFAKHKCPTLCIGSNHDVWEEVDERELLLLLVLLVFLLLLVTLVLLVLLAFLVFLVFLVLLASCGSSGLRRRWHQQQRRHHRQEERGLQHRERPSYRWTCPCGRRCPPGQREWGFRTCPPRS